MKRRTATLVAEELPLSYDVALLMGGCLSKLVAQYLDSHSFQNARVHIGLSYYIKLFIAESTFPQKVSIICKELKILKKK